MRRLLFITAFALFLAVPVWAQRGGGHAGGGHTGFSGGHGGSFGARGGFSGGHFGGGHFSGGMRSGFTRSGRSGFSGRPFLHNGFRGSRIRNFAFRNNCFGCRRQFFPWWGAGYYDPWLWDWWDSASSYDEDYERNLAIANQMNQQNLEEQRLLRQEEADGDQDSYSLHSRSRSNPDPSDDQKSSAIISPTVLVFRDQHQKEIRNYAIVGQTLWNFTSPRTEKIPLADLDLAATVKANDDRGITFRVPPANEAE